MTANKEDDNPYLLWLRNVRDEYKAWSTEKIKHHLDDKALPISVLVAQVQGDFNFGSIVRNCNNFGCQRIYYYGPRRKWNKKPAISTYKYLEVKYLPSIEDVVELKVNHTFIALENNIDGTIPIRSFDWQTSKRPLLILGEEGPGVPSELMNLADIKIEIPSMGSTRSINVGSASAIALYDFISKII